MNLFCRIFPGETEKLINYLKIIEMDVNSELVISRPCDSHHVHPTEILHRSNPPQEFPCLRAVGATELCTVLRDALLNWCLNRSNSS